MIDHTKLRVWQRAHALAVSAHRALAVRSAVRVPGLSAQSQRALASIPANIAEGASQDSRAQLARFLTIAIASASEAENHLAYARDTGRLSTHTVEQLSNEVREVRRMLVGLRKWAAKPTD